MALTIDTNQPDEPISGDSLMRRSVAGRKQQWSKQTTVGTVTVTLGSLSTYLVTVTFSGWAEEITQAANANANNLVSWDNSVTWTYEDIFIDTNSSTYAIGSDSLTADQNKVTYYKNETITQYPYSGSTNYTATIRYFFTNNGSSTHTIYFYVQCKYILFGEGSK